MFDPDVSERLVERYGETAVSSVDSFYRGRDRPSGSVEEVAAKIGSRLHRIDPEGYKHERYTNDELNDVYSAIVNYGPDGETIHQAAFETRTPDGDIDSLYLADDIIEDMVNGRTRKRHDDTVEEVSWEQYLDLLDVALDQDRGLYVSDQARDRVDGPPILLDEVMDELDDVADRYTERPLKRPDWFDGDMEVLEIADVATYTGENPVVVTNDDRYAGVAQHRDNIGFMTPDAALDELMPPTMTEMVVDGMGGFVGRFSR